MSFLKTYNGFFYVNKDHYEVYDSSCTLLFSIKFSSKSQSHPFIFFYQDHLHILTSQSILRLSHNLTEYSTHHIKYKLSKVKDHCTVLGKSYFSSLNGIFLFEEGSFTKTKLNGNGFVQYMNGSLYYSVDTQIRKVDLIDGIPNYASDAIVLDTNFKAVGSHMLINKTMMLHTINGKSKTFDGKSITDAPNFSFDVRNSYFFNQRKYFVKGYNPLVIRSQPAPLFANSPVYQDSYVVLAKKLFNAAQGSDLLLKETNIKPIVMPLDSLVEALNLGLVPLSTTIVSLVEYGSGEFVLPTLNKSALPHFKKLGQCLNNMESPPISYFWIVSYLDGFNFRDFYDFSEIIDLSFVYEDILASDFNFKDAFKRMNVNDLMEMSWESDLKNTLDYVNIKFEIQKPWHCTSVSILGDNVELPVETEYIA